MQLGCNKKNALIGLMQKWEGKKDSLLDIGVDGLVSKCILRKLGAYVLDTCLTILR
jgi:hypothetical protein